MRDVEVVTITALKQIHLDVDVNIRGSGLTRHRFK